jgi:hypothetical protein
MTFRKDQFVVMLSARSPEPLSYLRSSYSRVFQTDPLHVQSRYTTQLRALGKVRIRRAPTDVWNRVYSFVMEPRRLAR